MLVGVGGSGRKARGCCWFFGHGLPSWPKMVSFDEFWSSWWTLSSSWTCWTQLGCAETCWSCWSLRQTVLDTSGGLYLGPCLVPDHHHQDIQPLGMTCQLREVGTSQIQKRGDCSVVQFCSRNVGEHWDEKKLSFLLCRGTCSLKPLPFHCFSGSRGFRRQVETTTDCKLKPFCVWT